MAKAIKACRVPGCNRPTNGPHGRGALGMCGRHYQRYRKHGDPEGGRTAEGVPMEWLQQHASFDGEACLTWPFGRGRGNVSVGGKSTAPARAMCLLAYGPPPTPSHQAAHSCGRGGRWMRKPQAFAVGNGIGEPQRQERARDNVARSQPPEGETVCGSGCLDKEDLRISYNS